MPLAPLSFHATDRLDQLTEAAATSAILKFAEAGVTPENLGICVLQLKSDSSRVEMGDFRGHQAMYPASVVKLFFLAYAAHLSQTDVGLRTDEFERATHDMIKQSSNDGTALVVDMLTETTGGPELSPYELGIWMDQRQRINRWLRSLGYEDQQVSQKTWNEAAYGREKQAYGSRQQLRNSLDAFSAARMMAEVVTGRIANPKLTEWMTDLLSRKVAADGETEDIQSSQFVGQVLPAGTKLWSKAGYMSTARHDVAYFELPSEARFVFAIFTQNVSHVVDLIPFVASELLRGLQVEPYAP